MADLVEEALVEGGPRGAGKGGKNVLEILEER